MVTRIPARMIETTGVTPGSYSAADITVNSAGQITSASTSSVASSGGGPKITSIVVTDSSYTNTDDTAVGLSGGYIKITGTGFVSGCSIIVGATVATSVSFINSTEVRAQVPAQSAGTYTVYLVNSDGGVGIRVNGLNYSSTPTWTTTSPLGDGSIDSAISIQLAATSNSTVTYALEAGSTLPAGLSLSSSGLLSGTVTGITVDTTYNFTVVATDAENQDTPQAFSITITVSDPNFKNTVLLLQADTAPTVISDASTNNFDLSVAGDARASNFTPYGTGWSVYFDGTNDYLTSASNADFNLGTTFSVEGWVYSLAATKQVIANLSGFVFIIESTGLLNFYNGSTLSGGSGSAVSRNTWVHVTFTRDASNVVRGFVNGVLTWAITVSTASSQTAVFIGSEGGTQSFVNGYLSNIRIVKGAIPSSYQTSSTTAGTTIFTPPTSNLTEISGTSLLICQSNRFVDNSTVPKPITPTNGPLAVAFNPFNITNTGTDGSMYFDGTGDYCTTSGNAAFALGTGDFCLETWIYPNSISTGTFDRIVATSDYNGAGFDWTLNTASSALYVAGTAYSISNLVVKSWNHLVYTRSGGVLRGFLNGNLAVYNASATGNVTSTGELRIGTGYSGTAYNGYISNLRIVKGSIPAAYQTSSTTINTTVFSPPTTLLTAVTGTSLLTLQYDQPHNNHTFLDSSSNQHLITRSGNASQGTFSPFSLSGWSNYFDGTGDYLSIPTNTAFDLPGDFTIEYWVYVVPLAGNSNYHIITRGYYQSGAQDWLVAVGSDYNAFMAWGNPSTGSSAGFITPNTWFHIAFARSGTTLRAFKNGVLSNSITTSVNLTNTQAVNIGTNSANSANNLMSGYISNLRIVKGTALYTTNFTPPTSPLTSVANTSLLACHANRFIDGSANNFTVTRNGDTRITAFGPFSTTTYSATSNGGSAYFDGTGDDLVLPINTAFALGTDNFTIEAWIYPTQTSCSVFTMSASGVNQFVFTHNISGTTGGSSNGTAQLWMSTGGGSGIFGPTNAVVQNAWNHIAAVRQSGTVTVYVNGIAGTGVSNTTNVTGVYTPKIGSLWSHSASVTPACYISALRIVKGTAVYTGNFTPPTAPPTAITNTSLLLNCTDAAVRDARGLAVLETVGDAKVGTVQVKYGTGSMYFDGTGDYVKVVDTLPFAFGANNFTVEFWMNATTSTNPGRIINYWSTSTATAASWQFLTGGTTLFFGCGTAGTSNEVNISGTISLNTWTHIAGVRNGNVFTLYINGTQAATTTQAITLQTANTVTIGARNNAGTYAEFFAGYLDDVRITRGIARYTANFTPPAAKFLAR